MGVSSIHKRIHHKQTKRAKMFDLTIGGGAVSWTLCCSGSMFISAAKRLRVLRSSDLNASSVSAR